MQIFTPVILSSTKRLWATTLTIAAFYPSQMQRNIGWEYSTAEKDDI